MAVTLHSSRFGDLEIPDEAVIEFPNGLIGLGGTHYALLARNDDSAFVWLHSLDDPTVYVTVRATDSLEDFSANLYAPILISSGRGHQVINQTADAPVRAPLFKRPATEDRVQAA